MNSGAVVNETTPMKRPHDPNEFARGLVAERRGFEGCMLSARS